MGGRAHPAPRRAGPSAAPHRRHGGRKYKILYRDRDYHGTTIGALAALRHRDKTGEGQVIDVCLLDSALTMVEIPAVYYLATGQEGGESGRPPYRAKDGWVVMTGDTFTTSTAAFEVVLPERLEATTS